MHQPSRFHLVGHVICPYVQRVVILCTEKKIPYKRTDIELDNKPEWLLKISPTAKVPVLIESNATVLFDSNVICEYLDEISSDSLHPKDVTEKAIHRAWIAFATEILDCIAKIIYRDNSCSCVNNSLREITNKLQIVESVLSEGEFFAGCQFHLVDAVYATLFRYFDILGSLTTLELFSGVPRIRQWSEALLDRPSVKNAVPCNYNELLITFIKKRDSYISQLDFS
ncbi:glutathione S-transferase family protein [Alteromonadaceae bacterium BrNp21-10]|nr:glutathione S-transferase family protein [Alteromonadaceae bacterium BrNp21-10]